MITLLSLLIASLCGVAILSSPQWKALSNGSAQRYSEPLIHHALPHARKIGKSLADTLALAQSHFAEELRRGLHRGSLALYSISSRISRKFLELALRMRKTGAQKNGGSISIFLRELGNK